VSKDGSSKVLRADGADWSPDGRRIAATVGYPGDIAIFDLDSRDYSVVAKFEPTSPKRAYQLRWLNDGRRLLFRDAEGAVRLLDTETGRQKEVLRVAPDSVSFFCLSRDDKVMYFSRRISEADIWMLTLDEER
jgi:WD40 repeat protein